MKELLDEAHGVKLLSYTYPQGLVSFRVMKGHTVLAMTRSYQKAQEVFNNEINKVAFK